MTRSASTLNSTDCRFCSVVSKMNREDPIGSAWHYDQWIVIEMPQPWIAGLWVEHPTLQPIFQIIQDLRKETGAWIRPLAIAPDRAYSEEGHTRVLYYQKPAPLFAAFRKQEFLIPTDQILPLAIALLQEPERLSNFDTYRQPLLTRDLLVCTHGNVDVACSRFGYPIYQTLRRDYANEYLRVWRCSHFGGHNFAPTLIDLPTGHYWGHLEPQILHTLVTRQGDVSTLYRYYRGWAGLQRFEQMVEREIWMQQGWKWLEYRKSGRAIAIDTTQDDEWSADWATIQIDFQSPDKSMIGRYEATVEMWGSVMTQHQSGIDRELEPVKQYQVTSLSRSIYGST